MTRQKGGFKTSLLRRLVVFFVRDDNIKCFSVTYLVLCVLLNKKTPTDDHLVKL